MTELKNPHGQKDKRIYQSAREGWFSALQLRALGLGGSQEVVDHIVDRQGDQRRDVDLRQCLSADDTSHRHEHSMRHQQHHAESQP